MGVHKTFGGAFKSLYRQLNSVQGSLPRVLANEGTRFFISNFQLEGFTNLGFDHWQSRKPVKKPNRKKLLVKSGRLRRAVNNSNSERSYKRIVWRVDRGEVPYAARHNEGLDGMPRRHFMGKSEFLNRRFKLRIRQAYIKAFG